MTDPLHDLETFRREFRNAAAERYDNGANEADAAMAATERMGAIVRTALQSLVIHSFSLGVAREQVPIKVLHFRDVLAEAVADELHLTPEAARVFLAMVRA